MLDQIFAEQAKRSGWSEEQMTQLPPRCCKVIYRHEQWTLEAPGPAAGQLPDWSAQKCDGGAGAAADGWSNLVSGIDRLPICKGSHFKPRVLDRSDCTDCECAFGSVCMFLISILCGQRRPRFRQPVGAVEVCFFFRTSAQESKQTNDDGEL